MRMYSPNDADKDKNVSKSENYIQYVNMSYAMEVVVELELDEGNPKFFARITDMEPKSVSSGDEFICKIHLWGASFKKEYVSLGQTIYFWGGGRTAFGKVDEIF